ncbi:HEAT repeat domain-containing protein [bacterium]|nr:HEAT repeat domain-containing protein [bacterium]MCI0606553.1 HEAT repeat domain-containing protein [bacterium]
MWLWWIKRQLASSDEEIRTKAWRKLIAAESPSTFDLAVYEFKSGNEESRYPAGLLLCKLADVRSLDLLVEMLEDESSQNKGRAFEALLKLRDSRVVPVLMRFVENEQHSWQQRKQALKALSALGWQPADPGQKLLLTICMRDEPLLLSMWEQSREYLIRLLEHKDAGLRSDAAKLLSNLADAECFDALTKGLKDSDEDVRGYCALALGRLNDPRAVGPLLDLLRTRKAELFSDEIRSALSNIGTKDAIEALEYFERLEERKKKLSPAYSKTSAPAHVNLSPGSKVPITGEYKCEFCEMKPVTLDPRLHVALDQVTSMDKLKPTVKRFEAGSKFSECPGCKEATGWTLISSY